MHLQAWLQMDAIFQVSFINTEEEDEDHKLWQANESDWLMLGAVANWTCLPVCMWAHMSTLLLLQLQQAQTAEVSRHKEALMSEVEVLWKGKRDHTPSSARFSTSDSDAS